MHIFFKTLKKFDCGCIQFLYLPNLLRLLDNVVRKKYSLSHLLLVKYHRYLFFIIKCHFVKQLQLITLPYIGTVVLEFVAERISVQHQIQDRQIHQRIQHRHISYLHIQNMTSKDRGSCKIASHLVLPQMQHFQVLQLPNQLLDNAEYVQPVFL